VARCLGKSSTGRRIPRCVSEQSVPETVRCINAKSRQVPGKGQARYEIECTDNFVSPRTARPHLFPTFWGIALHQFIKIHLRRALRTNIGLKMICHLWSQTKHAKPYVLQSMEVACVPSLLKPHEDELRCFSSWDH
jgi:hypothetical protein